MSSNQDNRRSEKEQSAPDPFDPATLRLSQDFTNMVGVKKVLTKVPCRKPHRQEFFRVRAGSDWRVDTAILEDIVDRESYLVAADLLPDIDAEVRFVCLRLAINKQGDPFIWPLKLPGPDGRRNHWHESAIQAATVAEKKWVRISANMTAGLYDVYEATGDLAEPTWPEQNYRDLLELAFRDRRIDNNDHPVLRALRGEV